MTLWKMIGQVLAIVASILLAFAIDAWWVKSQETEDIDQLLSVFADELAADIVEVEKELAFRKAKSNAAREILLLASKGGAGEPTIAEFDAHLYDLMWWGFSTFATSALESIITSGNLSRIESVELRSRIAGWKEEMLRVTRFEQQDYDSYQTKLLPFLVESTNLPQISNAADGKPGTGEYSPYELPVAARGDHRPLLENEEFLALVTVTVWDQEDAWPALERFLGLAEQLEELVVSAQAK